MQVLDSNNNNKQWPPNALQSSQLQTTTCNYNSLLCQSLPMGMLHTGVTIRFHSPNTKPPVCR